MFITTPEKKYTANWVYNVAQNGIFIKNNKATWSLTGSDSVPSGWTVETASN